MFFVNKYNNLSSQDQYIIKTPMKLKGVFSVIQC